MPKPCPLCGQPVHNLDEEELQHRLAQLASPLLRQEKQRLEENFEERIEAEKEKATKAAEKRLASEWQQKINQVRKAAAEQTEKSFTAKLAAAEKKAIEAETKLTEKVEAARTEMQRKYEKQNTAAVQQAVRDAQKRFEKSEIEREKERLRFEADRIRLQDQLEKLSRKLEAQSGEELGEDGERDLAVLLRQAFLGDRIERIKKGVKGADIIHCVMEGAKQCGRIVYESKNVSQWSNAFIAQAKKHQTQYETPHVIVVSNVFPNKQKSMCICDDIPVVSLRTAVPLATIVREAILEVSKLKVSDFARDEKSRELFEYIISDRFGTRFREIVDTIETLRDQQRKERTWHENAWENRSKLHDRLDSRQSEIAAQIRSITSREPKVLQIAAKASQ